jgi:hypothetical protein
LVATAKLNGVEPQAWLTDVLERMVSGRTKAHQLERLLPWAWKPSTSWLPSMPERRHSQTRLAAEHPDCTRTGAVTLLIVASKPLGIQRE